MPNAFLRIVLTALALINADLAALMERLAVGNTGMTLRSLFMLNDIRSILMNILANFIRLFRSTRAG